MNRLGIAAAFAILSIFLILCLHNIVHYSATYDEPKFLEVAQQLASGDGWQTEMSVVHAPLSFYTHGFLLKPFRFSTPDERLRWARVVMLVYPLALGMLIYVWAAKLFGAGGALMALTMYCFNSNILGHSSLITTDIIYACFSLFLLYCFWRFLSENRFRWVLASGACLGLALLSKYSAVIWFILLPFLWLTIRLWNISRRDSRLSAAAVSSLRWKSDVPCIIGIFVVAVLIVNAGYGFSRSFEPLGANHYQSRALAALSENPIASRIPAPMPYPFVRGYDEQKYISEVGHPSFLAGMRSTRGWLYYYLACFFLKMPLAFWALLGWACVRIWREADPRRKNSEIILAVSTLAIILASSLLSRSHAGFRYVFASLPPLFILSGATAADIFQESETDATRRRKWMLLALAVLYVVPSLRFHPHHIAYFNILAGGPKNGYKWLSDSNLDWGQDVDHAREYVKRSQERIWVNPEKLPVPGTILINATSLQDCFTVHPIHDWLKGFEPVDYVGYSWLVFELTPRTIREQRPEHLPFEYYMAAFAYAADRLTEAESLAREALDKAPHLPEAHYLLGLSSLGLGKLRQSSEALETIDPLSMLYADARANLSFIAAIQDDRDASRLFRRQSMVGETLSGYPKTPSVDVEGYKRALADDAENWKLRNNLGVSLWARGELQEAERELRLAYQIQPDFSAALSNLAVILEEQGRFGEAYDAMRRHNSEFLLLRTSPYRDYRVHYEGNRVMLGDTLEIYPKPEENVLSLKSHLQGNPLDFSGMNQLAVLLIRCGRFAEAYEHLKHATAVNPTSSVLYTNLAVLYTEKKMFAYATDACRKALELEPGNSVASELLASIGERVAASEGR